MTNKKLVAMAIATTTLLLLQMSAPAYALSVNYRGLQGTLTPSQKSDALNVIHSQLPIVVSGVTVLGITFDVPGKSAILTVDSSSCPVEGCTVQVQIPTLLLNSQNCTGGPCTNDMFIVLADGQGLSYVASDNPSVRTLTLTIQNGTSRVEIIGTTFPVFEQMLIVKPRNKTKEARITIRESAPGELLSPLVTAVLSATLVGPETFILTCGVATTFYESTGQISSAGVTYVNAIFPPAHDKCTAEVKLVFSK